MSDLHHIDQQLSLPRMAKDRSVWQYDIRMPEYGRGDYRPSVLCVDNIIIRSAYFVRKVMF